MNCPVKGLFANEGTMSNIYSVTQINQYVKNMFQTDYLLNKISVQGEVSNCKYHPTGHIYFTLKDTDGTLSAVMFAGNRRGLNFTMKEGQQVIVTGKISVYERDGKYQMYASLIEEAGQGVRYEQFLKLKAQLEEMGMFDPMYKKAIPGMVKTLGVVTASSGAALQDIIKVATRRNPYIQIVLFPALVQGEGAVKSICRGIRCLDEYGVDVMIVGRGGGSIEDLWAFNEEEVARTIFDCKTPVISAVGHETDFTIADFVSDLRAPTPSAAAELAVCDMEQINRQLVEKNLLLGILINNKLKEYRNRLDNIHNKLKYLSPENKLNEHYRRLADYQDILDRKINDKIKDINNKLAIYCSRISDLSPLLKLSSGYSYVSDNEGRAITSVQNLTEGDKLSIHMKDGVVDALVQTVIDIDRENIYEN